MSIPNFIRDANVIKKKIKTLGDKLIALDDLKVYFPATYVEKGLAQVGEVVQSLGIVMVVSGSTYGVLSVNTKINFTPIETNQVTLNNEGYYELVFEKGSTMVDDINCLNQDTLPYYIYDLFISKGKIPFYLDYLDMCHLFDTASSYAGANVGERPEVIHMVISLIARDEQDRSRYYRQIAKGYEDVEKRLSFIPIRSVEYGATNTINKLGGSYFQTGVVSSLVSPTTEVENIESILRY